MACCCGVSTPDSEMDELKGPVRNRHCTDKIMLLVFLLFAAGLGAIAIISVRSGDPRRIVYGTDSWGNLCGRDNEASIARDNSGLNLANHSYLYYSDPLGSGFRICVSACPSADIDCSANNAQCLAAGVCLGSSSNPYSTAGAGRRARGREGGAEGERGGRVCVRVCVCACVCVCVCVCVEKEAIEERLSHPFFPFLLLSLFAFASTSPRS